MVKVGIVVAMSSEFELLSKLIESPQTVRLNNFLFIEGNIGNKAVILAKSGIGKVCAAVMVTELINKYKPDYIINSGLAGGIDNNIKVLDVVVGSKVVYHDVWCGEGNAYGQVQDFPEYYEADEKLLNKIMENPNLHKGLICSGDKFISNQDELLKIKNDFPLALAVDMESAAIAQVCYIYKVPFLSMRIISDNPGIDNHWQQYQDFWTLAPKMNLSLLKEILQNI